MGLGGYVAVFATFAIALLLSALRLPAFAPDVLGWLRPDWVAMVLLYWVLALPQRIGLLTGWIVGLLLDSVSGSVLGQHALLMTLVSWLGLALYERMRMYSLVQQALLVFVLLAVIAAAGAGIEYLVRGVAFSPAVFASAAVGALLWPFLFLGLRQFRRSLRLA